MPEPTTLAFEGTTELQPTDPKLNGDSNVDPRIHGYFGSMFFPGEDPLEEDLPDPRLLAERMTFLEPDAQSASERLENVLIPAGYTFFGQFLTHDLTFDPTSVQERVRDPEAVRNFRTPELDLDSLYGSGPRAMPWLYDPDYYGMFILNRDEDAYDVDRNRKGQPLMADPRNDENLVLAQLHVAFLKLHNLVLRRLAQNRILAPEERFHEARRIVILLYQYILWRDYLPRICMSVVLDYFRRGGQPLFFRYAEQTRYGEPYLPIEFNSALRFGHPQIKPRYRINTGLEADFISEQTQKNLRCGGRPITANQRVDWSYFFGDEEAGKPDRPQLSRLIRTQVSAQAGNIPEQDVAPGQVLPSRLTERDLRRAKNWGVPSGERVAKAIDTRIRKEAEHNEILQSFEKKYPKFLDRDEIWPKGYEAFRENKAPLLYYILREAWKQEGGKRLGFVGSCIIAEVIHGLLKFEMKPVGGKGEAKDAMTMRTTGLFQGSKEGETWNPWSEPSLTGLLEEGNRFTMSDLLRIVDTRKPVQLTRYNANS